MKLTQVEHDPKSAFGHVAALGNGSDKFLAHMARGDTVIPVERITPGVRALLAHVLGKDLEQFTVGSKANHVNKKTGLIEFYDGGESGGEAGDSGFGGGFDGSHDAGANDSGGHETLGGVDFGFGANGVSSNNGGFGNDTISGNPDASMVEQQQAAGNKSLDQNGPATISGGYGIGQAGRAAATAVGLGLGIPALSTALDTTIGTVQANQDLSRFGASQLSGGQVLGGALNTATMGLSGKLGLGGSLSDAAIDNAATALGIGAPAASHTAGATATGNTSTSDAGFGDSAEQQAIRSITPRPTAQVISAAAPGQLTPAAANDPLAAFNPLVRASYQQMLNYLAKAQG